MKNHRNGVAVYKNIILSSNFARGSEEMQSNRFTMPSYWTTPQGTSKRGFQLKNTTILICLAPILMISLYKLATTSELNEPPMGPLCISSCTPQNFHIPETSVSRDSGVDPIYDAFSMNPASDNRPFNGPSLVLAIALIVVFSFCLVL